MNEMDAVTSCDEMEPVARIPAEPMASRTLKWLKHYEGQRRAWVTAAGIMALSFWAISGLLVSCVDPAEWSIILRLVVFTGGAMIVIGLQVFRGMVFSLGFSLFELLSPLRVDSDCEGFLIRHFCSERLLLLMLQLSLLLFSGLATVGLFVSESLGFDSTVVGLSALGIGIMTYFCADEKQMLLSRQSSFKAFRERHSFLHRYFG